MMPEGTVLLPPALAPPAAYYAAMAAAGRAAIALASPYDKRRKETHRYEIADTRGRLRLTVPVQPPHGIPHARWSDVSVSGHGRWQDVHATTLASAYGRTPYYEFYIDRLAPALFAPEGTPLTEQIKAVNAAVCKILLIDTPVDYDASDVVQMPSEPVAGPYWQVRADSLGFLGGLSVLDLIFNLGPEAALCIRRCGKPMP
ncbi:MAG: WbqC family protein [Muribaculaceae bacterium]|nr:WbqC family protein [Muribaculaceae bacterium]